MAISRWPYVVRTSKDPNAVLDYSIDWTEWLEETETITDSEWEASSGTIEDSSFDEKTTQVWLSGGEAGETITLTNRVTTDSSPVERIDDRSLLIKVEER